MKVKPVVVHDYNQHMLGVDKLDQLASYYSFLHKSVKWWRRVFFLVGGGNCSQQLHPVQAADGSTGKKAPDSPWVQA